MTLTLSRPHAINAINRELQSALEDALTRAESDDTLRVIVLRGEGTRGFCAGIDLKEPSKPLSTLQEQQVRSRPRWIERLARLPIPTVAVIHGHCIGAGLEAAMACDIRVCTPGTLLSLPEVGRSSLPGSGGARRLVDLVGRSRATDMLLTGMRVSAQTALQYGLVTRILGAEHLEAELSAIVESLTRGSRAVTVLAKQMLRMGGDQPTTLAAEAAMVALVLDRAQKN